MRLVVTVMVGMFWVLFIYWIIANLFGFFIGPNYKDSEHRVWSSIDRNLDNVINTAIILFIILLFACPVFKVPIVPSVIKIIW